VYQICEYKKGITNVVTLIEKIQADKRASERRIAQLRDEIANQENDIRQITAAATAVEMVRLLPDKLKDLEVRLVWLHGEQEKQTTLNYYLKCK
jgi:septal ring factor EnvC (AmiA/AmiB activator)